MASVTIFVSRNGNSKNIKLRDSEGHNPGNDDLTTTVDPGDTVTWELDTNSGLGSIVSIAKKASSPNNLFSSITSEDDIFFGTVVSVSPGKGQYETYAVQYTIPGDTTVYSDDPKIQMDK